ncbi:MAG: hypothetical protein MHMPM18_000007 [Marteilia pararefringens]
MAEVENIIAIKDSQLMDFFKTNNITIKEYAIPIVDNFFSKLFGVSKLLILFDNIIATDKRFIPSFAAACVIQYRDNMLRCENIEKISCITTAGRIDFYKALKSARELYRSYSNEKIFSQTSGKKLNDRFMPISTFAYPIFEAMIPISVPRYFEISKERIRKEEEDYIRNKNNKSNESNNSDIPKNRREVSIADLNPNKMQKTFIKLSDARKARINELKRILKRKELHILNQEIRNEKRFSELANCSQIRRLKIDALQHALK